MGQTEFVEVNFLESDALLVAYIFFYARVEMHHFRGVLRLGAEGDFNEWPILMSQAEHGYSLSGSFLLFNVFVLFQSKILSMYTHTFYGYV